jgi:hypothetical protein
MLQPNPVKRIKLSEILQHPWYLKNLPDYLRELSIRPAKLDAQVDLDIVKQLFEVSFKIY